MSQLIQASTSIDRPPDEVFDYVSDPALLPTWQPSVDEAAFEPPGRREVGTRGHEVRRTLLGRQTITWQVTVSDPGRRWGVRGTEGPVRAHVAIDLSPTDGGRATRVDYTLSFTGRGIGRLIRLLAQRGAREEVPQALALLKGRLEETPARR